MVLSDCCGWFPRYCSLLVVGCVLAAVGGCSSSEEEIDEQFEFGNLIETFDPPTLEALEKQVAEAGGWKDQPVLDSLQVLRDYQKENTPLVSVEEALKLKNDSDEANAKIISALSQLPQDDSEVDYDAEITRHTPQQLNHSNPLLSSSVTEQEVASLITFGLFTFDWNFTPFASSDAVKSWQTSTDGYYDKVVMRDDLTWSDGTPITAHDIVFSYKLIMTEAVPIRAQRSGTDKIKWIEAYDDHTLVYFHKKPFVTNIWNVNFLIVPKHKYEDSVAKDPTLADSDYHVELDQNPVTGGPYEIKSRSQTEIVMERRDSYFLHKGEQVREKPFIKTVRLRITPEVSVALLEMKAGNIDEMILDPVQWASQTNDKDFYKSNTKARGLEWTNFSFMWNVDKERCPYFWDKRVRWAMSYAFDHEEFLRTVRKGLNQPSLGTFHETSPWFPGSEDSAVQMQPEPLKMDREKAKELLDEAGWKDSDGDGYRDQMIDGKKRKFEFTLLVRNQADRIKACELFKQNLRAVGVACNVRTLESATLQDKMFNKKFEAAYSGWGTGADPDTSENIWGSGEDRNYGNYRNPLIDELFAEARKLKKDRLPWRELQLWQDQEAMDYLQIDAAQADKQPERADCYAAIHGLLWGDQPYTWLFCRNSFHGFNKKIRGYHFSPRGPFGYGPGFGSLWVPKER